MLMPSIIESRKKTTSFSSYSIAYNGNFMVSFTLNTVRFLLIFKYLIIKTRYKDNPLAEFQINGLTGKFAKLFKFPVILL